jgi:hypothetical protein
MSDPALGPDAVEVVVAAEKASHMTGATTFLSPSLHRVPATRPIPEIVAELNRLQPALLRGYPTALVALATEARAGRLRIAPRMITAHSEPLLPEARRAMEEAWGLPVMNGYGTTEGASGWSCAGGRGLHVNDDWCIFELVDADGRPVPRGERAAKIYVTNLMNFAQPLIRYELTDEVSAIDEPCSCGITLDRFDDIEGRTDDVFTYRRRRRLSADVPLAARTRANVVSIRRGDSARPLIRPYRGRRRYDGDGTHRGGSRGRGRRDPDVAVVVTPERQASGEALALLSAAPLGRPRRKRGRRQGGASSPRTGVRREKYFFGNGRCGRLFSRLASMKLQDALLIAVHRHQAVECPGPVLLGTVVAVGQDGQVAGGGQHRIGCELQVDGELGEGFAIDDHFGVTLCRPTKRKRCQGRRGGSVARADPPPRPRYPEPPAIQQRFLCVVVGLPNHDGAPALRTL